MQLISLLLFLVYCYFTLYIGLEQVEFCSRSKLRGIKETNTASGKRRFFFSSLKLIKECQHFKMDPICNMIVPNGLKRNNDLAINAQQGHKLLPHKPTTQHNKEVQTHTDRLHQKTTQYACKQELCGPCCR